MQKWLVICWALFALSGADECPDGGKCAEGQTCCKSPSNAYGCCPFDQAECCEDHVHCCPFGTLCNTATSRCVNATASIPWVERIPADHPHISKSFRMIKSHKSGDDDDNICPDLSRCPAEFSCLRTLTKFGCCPVANGVPCSDGKHCCPEGHQCSLNSRSCIKKETVNTVQCKDGLSECPDGTTCCETVEGKWACCPMPNAVCCEDKAHCCPEGTRCDIAKMKCVSPSTKKAVPMWAKFPARIRADWENQKDDKIETSEEAGDREKEINPATTTTNEASPKEEEVVLSPVAGEATVNDVPCNDTAACSDNNTCCKTKHGRWACCPIPEAVCCEDFRHCCPKGKKCNLAKQRCDDGFQSVPWLEKIPSISKKVVQEEVKDVPCDGSSACPDGTTCCKTKDGSWACCPMPEAVCCEDFIHCCPKGKKCNLAAQTCDDGFFSEPWMKKIPSKPTLGAQMQNVTCDPTAACPDGTTCCKTKDGSWACCPMPEAVCCEDHEHCCPSGTTCDLTTLSCQTGLSSVPMKQKIPAFSSKTQDTNTPEAEQITTEEENRNGKRRNRCDEHTRCPERTTCCFMALSKKWGCCPLPEAVCCKDGDHCCPAKFKCDERKGTCVKEKVEIPWYTTIPAEPSDDLTEPAVPSNQKDIKCDDKQTCTDSQTCCKTSPTTWGCCPLPFAVCCSDMIHCCPTTFSCTDSGSCMENAGLNWQNWHLFQANKKKALIL